MCVRLHQRERLLLVPSLVFRAGGGGGVALAARCGRALLCDLLDASTAQAACCGFDLCHKYILYFVFCILYLVFRPRASAPLGLARCLGMFFPREDFVCAFDNYRGRTLLALVFCCVPATRGVRAQLSGVQRSRVHFLRVVQSGCVCVCVCVCVRVCVCVCAAWWRRRRSLTPPHRVLQPV